ncbi:MAG: ribonuclease HII [Gammaproteobacteria bacterium]|jgi:ribonuclease HII
MIFSVHQTLPEFAGDILLAGVDEAGRGPLAGPVAAAAVILDPLHRIDGLADSKTLSSSRREQLAAQIMQHALSWAVCFAEAEEIDRLNILHATLAAMARAVGALERLPSVVLIDGNRVPQLPCEAHAVIKGDARVACISAASIVAKVSRDRRMVALHERYPQYGFAQHKGYSTQLHRAALIAHGPTPEHRRSFAPVRAALRCP